MAFLPHIVGWISKDMKDLPPSRTYDFHRIRLSAEFDEALVSFNIFEAMKHNEDPESVFAMDGIRIFSRIFH